MIRYNLRLAFRALWKKRIFSFINIGGLAIGLSAVLVIATYVREELSYDAFHENRSSIFRITEEYKDDVKQVHSAMNHGPIAELISEQLPGLKHAVRILPHPAYISVDKINKSRENRTLFADSTFFKVFSFQSIRGDLDKAFESPFTVVVTKSSAIKYFGSTDVVGRELFYEDERAVFSYHITAVIEDVPQNSHFTFDFLFNMSSLNTVMPWFNNWHYPSQYIYAMVEENTDPQVLKSNIQSIVDRFSPEEIKAEKRKYYVQPLRDIHLNSALENEWQANTQMAYIKLFSAVAVFLLVIACINFMNLSTAQTAQRAREVGVRKVIGAFRQQLVRQFLSEAFLISLLSLIVALGIAELLLMTFFKNLTGKDLSLSFLTEGYNPLFLLAFLVMISVLSGLYPSYYLSRFRPVAALKGGVEERGSVLGLRRTLVVFQFFVSGLLMIGTAVVLKQVNLLQNKNLGFDKEQLISLDLVDRFGGTNYLQLKNSLLEESSILSAGVSSEIPGGQNFFGLEINPEGFPKGTMNMNSLGMDEDFFNTFNIKTVSGRGFSKDITTDQREAIVLNESAVKFFGWTNENAIGKDFQFVVYTGQREVHTGKVIGVVQDFHYQTLHNKIEPLMMYINKHPYYCDFLTLKVNTQNIPAVVSAIKKRWKDFRPEKPIEFSFLDDRLQKQYESEMKIRAIFSSFAVLSVIISCLGLFGLSAFSSQRRTKEIGIRKVLGASVFQIVRLLSKEYIAMILIANILAWPLAYYAAAQWLANFPYRIEFGMEILLVTLFGALFIALLTVSVQSIRAALINPVKTLKSE